MGNVVIDFENVSFSYGTQSEGCLRNINLKIQAGEFVLLTGQSGSGKTTITRLINGLIPHFFEGILTGSVKVIGDDIKTVTPGEMGKNTASIFQNPRSQFFTTNSTNEVAFALENYGIDRYEMIARVNSAFRDFEAENLMDRDMFSLSSGEKQKIAIIAAKALKPKIYVFDEPSANLDIQSIIKLKKIMKILKEQGHTIIVSEHRLFYLKDLIDKCFIMKDGEIDRELKKNDIANLNDSDIRAYKLRTFKLSDIKYELKNNPIINKQNADFKVENLSFSYNVNHSILSNCNLEGNFGETVAIVGHNGNGKTTLGKIMSGLLKAKSGQFFIESKLTKQKNLHKSVYFVMQDADYQLYSDSVVSELMLSSMNSIKQNDEKIENAMTLLNISSFRNRHPQSLSGGQKQRVTIAAAIASNKKILIFDEPTSGLDYENMKGVSEAINYLRKKGKLIFVISHDLEFLSKVATKAVFIENNTIIQSIELKNEGDFETVKKFLLQSEE
ncbi:ABC transporter ATP-binding protein [Streptococcus anginosus]|uniref:ABC transporter ATP-binding protein n=1 Tax=Streptococcus anginosus TaxID=1328 RepID=UPI0034A1C7DC